MNKKLIALIAGVIIGGVGLFAFINPTALPSVGVALPETPALFETALSAPITSSATSFDITSNSIRGGGTLSGYSCFTIDEGSAQAEFVCGTASGTSITGVTRGVSPEDGVTSVSSLQYSHRRGASVKITNFPIIQRLKAQNNGDSTFENVLKYASGVTPTGADQLADVGYVLSVVNGGSVAFDKLIVQGIAGETVATGTLVYFDTTQQEWMKVDSDISSTFAKVPVGITQGAGVNGGTIGTGVLIAGEDTTQTGMTIGADYYASTTAGGIGITQTGLLVGRAKDATTLYFKPETDVTYLNNTFSGNNIFSGSNNFTGPVTFSASTTVTVFTTSGTWTKPNNLSYVVVEVVGGGGAGGGSQGSSGSDVQGNGGGAGGYSKKLILASSLGSSETVTIGSGGTGVSGGTGNNGGTTNFGSLVQATGGTGGSSGILTTPGIGGVGSLGDVNIKGENGFFGQYDGAGNETVSGRGGSSFYGIGGAGVYGGSSDVNGNNGSGYGSGGGGAYSNNFGVNKAGGAGADGVIIVTEYFN